MCYYAYFPSRIKNIRFLTRLVILPDYQGCGLGMKLINYTAEYLCRNGFIAYARTSSLSMIRGFNQSKKWICNGFGKGTLNKNLKILNKTVSVNRKGASFRYVGENNKYLKITRQ